MPHPEILKALKMSAAEWGLLAHEAINDPEKQEDLINLKDRGAKAALVERRAQARVREEIQEKAVMDRAATMRAEARGDTPLVGGPVDAPLEETSSQISDGVLDKLEAIEARLGALEAVWATLGTAQTTASDVGKE
jgi:hypothetical protein